MKYLKLLWVLFVGALPTLNLCHGENTASNVHQPDLIRPSNPSNSRDFLSHKPKTTSSAINPMKLIAPSIPSIRKPTSMGEEKKSTNWLTPSDINPDDKVTQSELSLSEERDRVMQELLREGEEINQAKSDAYICA